MEGTRAHATTLHTTHALPSLRRGAAGHAALVRAYRQASAAISLNTLGSTLDHTVL